MIGYEAAETGDEQITIGINIPTDVYLAIKKGEALLNTTLGKSGVTAWVQFLDPDRAHLTYTLEDAANELARASPPEGVIVPVYARPSTSERSNLNRIRMGITEAEDRITTKKLDRHRKQGVLNFYPTDSLVDEDFRRTDDKDFAARATVVAHRLGSANAISRITTTMGNHGSFETLSDWWDHADADDRAALLTKKKKFSGKCSTSRLLALACPFREAGFGKEADQTPADSSEGEWSENDM
jgi:hypothetical protein